MSILLSASAVEVRTIGGVTVETNDSAALISTTIDWNSNLMTWNFTTGHRLNGAIQPTTRGVATQVVLNLTTGTWVNSQNSSTGTVDPTALATLNAGLKNLRNGVESATIAQTIFAGTQVPW